jgi:hypothetical protein
VLQNFSSAALHPQHKEDSSCLSGFSSSFLPSFFSPAATDLRFASSACVNHSQETLKICLQNTRLQLTQKLKENKIPKTGPALKSYKKNEDLMRKRFATTTSLSLSLSLSLSRVSQRDFAKIQFFLFSLPISEIQPQLLLKIFC